MVTWSEFSQGSAEVQRPPRGDVRAPWEPFVPAASALETAGRRLLFESGDIALLATVAPSLRPRIHPFIPRLVNGRVWAFISSYSPKAGDLVTRPYTVHALPGAEDEEFWFSGRARQVTDPGLTRVVAEAMPYQVQENEVLHEFDLNLAMWTRWVGFGTTTIRPEHHRWRSGAAFPSGTPWPAGHPR